MTTNKPCRVALVVGANGRLGQAFARVLLEEGCWDVVLADIVLDQKDQHLQELPRLGGNSEQVFVDVTKRQDWQELIRQMRQNYASLDLLINTAGLAAGGEVEGFAEDDFRRVMEVNYFGTLFGCKAVIPWMKQQGQGHVINVASITGLLSPPAMAAYASSKAAVVSLTESLYTELKPHGIGVTLCAPGFFRSPLVANGLFSDETVRRRGQDYADRATLTAEKVARYTLERARRAKLYAVMGSRARWYWRVKRLAPGMFLKLLSRHSGSGLHD